MTTTPTKATEVEDESAFLPRSLFNMELRPEDVEVFAFVRKAYKSRSEAGRLLTKADTVRRAMKREAVRLGYKLKV